MPNYATTLQYPCPHCDEGAWDQAVSSDGNPIGPPDGHCGCSPEGHTAALQAAWVEYCDQDWSEQWNRRYAEGSHSTADDLHSMREAKRLKR